MSYSFVLIEQRGTIGEEIEASLKRCFSIDNFQRIVAKKTSSVAPSSKKPISYSGYDFVLIDCSVSLKIGVEYLKSIKQQASKSLVLLLSDHQEIETSALQESADGYFNFHGSWASLCAKIEMLIGLKNNLTASPFQVADWHLLEVLHNGNNSTVYRAVNQKGQQAAIKRYKYNLKRLSETSKTDFLTNLQQFSEINTPRLVKIYNSGISDGAIYQVMELMTQGSLEENVNDHERLPLHHALTWFIQIVYALHVVHEVGLLHRDLKPSNIMLRDDGSLALNDYGSASSLLIEAGVMTEDDIHCTPYYVSPERALDQGTDVSSDIYSLGIIFYELLVGDKPYHGSTEMELMMQHILAPLPTLPPEYATYQSLLNKMLAKEKEHRLQRVIDVVNYLAG
ncbi:MAG: protein kinase [Cocleimonas sp.]|nr:protein kinase [Cocleimonas sp.]